MAQIVEPLVGHAAGKGAVADDGHDVAARVGAALHRGGQAVGVTEGGRGVAVLDPVVHRLRSGRVARQPVGLAQRSEHLPPAGHQLVHVGLVAGVPDEVVAGRIEDPVQRQGQLDDPEVAAQVAAVGGRHRLDDEVADLRRQGRQLLVGRAAAGRSGR